MRSAILHTVLLVAAACRAGGTEGEPAPLTAAEARERMGPEERHARLVDYFPNIELVSHEGESARFYDDVIFGKVVLINFMYTTCEGI